MGVYKSKGFEDDIKERKQSLTFIGVAERSIHTVSESARAMLLYAAMHWPEKVSMDLWPFVIDYAVSLYNRMHH